MATQHPPAGHKSNAEDAERLEHDIEHTRSEIAATVSALGGKLSPAHVREQLGAELTHLEERVRAVVREQLGEAKALVKDELNEAKGLLREEMEVAEKKVKQGLGEARDTVKRDLQEAVTGAKESLRAATIGKLETFATDVGDKMNDARDTLMDTVRNNPIPAALTGIGLVWLLMNRSTSSRERRDVGVRGYAGGSARQQNRDGAAGDYDENHSGRSFASYDGTDQSGIGHFAHQAGEAVSHAASAIGDAAHQATEAVGHGFSSAADAAGKVVHDASTSTRAFLHDAGDTASHIAEQVGHTATSLAAGAKKNAMRLERQVESTYAANPLMLGAVAAAVGAVAGFSLPRTHGEDVVMGEMSENVMHRAGDLVHQAAGSVARLAEQNLGMDKDSSKQAQGGAAPPAR